MSKKPQITILSGFFLSILWCLNISAQTSGPKTVFWEISGNGLEKNSYLFGTMHILPKDEFEAFDLADDILSESELLILEMEIDVPMSVQMEWAKKLILPENTVIPDFMKEKDYKALKSYAIDSLGIKEFLFNTYIKLKPYAFYSALLPHAIGKKTEGYELYFSKIARKKNISVHGLEDFDFQIGIFDSIPNEKQMNMFFDNIPDMKKEIDEMVVTYKEQDIYKMAAAIKEEGGKYAEMEEELLILRNYNWAEQLDSLMKENSCFVAVGAAHLAGENGLIKLLRQKKYDVRGLMLKNEEIEIN